MYIINKGGYCQLQLKQLREFPLEPITVLVVSGIIATISAIVSGFILNRSKSQDAKIDKLIDTVGKLENTAVSDSHVRAVVKEELQPLQSLMEKIDSGMNGIKEYIAEDRGFKRGEAAGRRRKEEPEQQ